MFKAICDIVLVGKTIEYDNCKVCYVGGLKATSSGEDPSMKEAQQFANAWSKKVLNPKNPRNSKAYSAILKRGAKLGFDSLKYIGVFEIDPGLGNQIKISKGLQVVLLYETIIAKNEPQDTTNLSDGAFTTGYRPYHLNPSEVKVTNSTKNTFLTFGVLTNVGGLSLDLEATRYLLDNKGTLTCTAIQDAKEEDEATQFHHNGRVYTKYSSDNFDDYMKFLERGVIKQLQTNLASMRRCDDKVNKGQATVFIDASKGKNLDEIRTFCKDQGGTLKSMRAILDEICQDSDNIVSWHPAFSITCANYNDILTFDDEGEIVDSHMFAVTLGSETHSLHNEL